MTTACAHPEGSLTILAFLPNGYVKADCAACGQHGITVKYSESFEDQLDVEISDLMMAPEPDIPPPDLPE